MRLDNFSKLVQSLLKSFLPLQKKDMDPVTKSTDISTQSTNGQSKTEVLSSNNTLFWRIFVPTFGTVFFTGLLLAFWFTNMDDFDLATNTFWGLRIAFTLLWVVWLVFIYRTLLKLKRVDASDTHIYVTNYWTTVRYPWEEIKATTERKRLGKRIVTFHLNVPGRFGERISFLPGSHFDSLNLMK
jgi:hypothetical protein